jgi:hypothetical protein
MRNLIGGSLGFGFGIGTVIVVSHFITNSSSLPFYSSTGLFVSVVKCDSLF